MLFLAKIFPINKYSDDGKCLGVDTSISDIKLINVNTPQPTDIVQIEQINNCLNEYFTCGHIKTCIWCDGKVVRLYDEQGEELFSMQQV